MLTNRQTALYTLAGAMAYGAFFPWLGSSIRMIETIYGREGQFAWFFGLNAIFMAAAVLTTARAVTLFGTYRVALGLSVAVVATAIVFVVPASSDGGISFWVFFALRHFSRRSTRAARRCSKHCRWSQWVTWREPQHRSPVS